MWLAQFVCAPQFFKTPKGLCGHTVYCVYLVLRCQVSTYFSYSCPQLWYLICCVWWPHRSRLISLPHLCPPPSLYPDSKPDCRTARVLSVAQYLPRSTRQNVRRHSCLDCFLSSEYTETLTLRFASWCVTNTSESNQEPVTEQQCYTQMKNENIQCVYCHGCTQHSHPGFR
jgi:hypothetical protein